MLILWDGFSEAQCRSAANSTSTTADRARSTPVTQPYAIVASAASVIAGARRAVPGTIYPVRLRDLADGSCQTSAG